MECKLYFNDNLQVLKAMKSESVDLIYADPPFNSNSNWKGEKSQKFIDIWKWDKVAESAMSDILQLAVNSTDYDKALKTLIGFNTILMDNEKPSINDQSMHAYLVFLACRLVEIKRVMKPTASFYLQCDSIACHYIKILLDRLFGRDCFRREIIWQTQNPSGFKSQANNWIRHHDTIFYYVKSLNDFTFNKQYLPYDSEYYANFNREDKDGLYHARDFAESGFRKVRLGKGKSIGDIWTDIKHMGITPKEERTRYPTQKPIDLLKRIILASSNEGDIVLDPFAGSGSTSDASERLHRLWIAIDSAEGAIDTIMNRLAYHHGFLPDRDYELIGDKEKLTIPIKASAIQTRLF